MSTKRQQTMAKIERERTVRERRARKQEKKLQRKLEASGAGDQPVDGQPVEETVPVPTAD